MINILFTDKDGNVLDSYTELREGDLDNGSIFLGDVQRILNRLAKAQRREADRKKESSK